MKRSIAERFEARLEQAQLMDRIRKTNPRLSQAIAATQIMDRQRANAERFRKRK